MGRPREQIRPWPTASAVVRATKRRRTKARPAAGTSSRRRACPCASTTVTASCCVAAPGDLIGCATRRNSHTGCDTVPNPSPGSRASRLEYPRAGSRAGAFVTASAAAAARTTNGRRGAGSTGGWRRRRPPCRRRSRPGSDGGGDPDRDCRQRLDRLSAGLSPLSGMSADGHCPAGSRTNAVLPRSHLARLAVPSASLTSPIINPGPDLPPAEPEPNRVQ